MRGTPLGLLLALGCVQAGAPAVEMLKDAPPVELAEAQRGLFAPTVTRVLRAGQPFLDLWFRTVVPSAVLRTGPGIRYGSLVPGSLVGAVRVYDGASDYKGQKIAAGVYTLRYAVQPDDGDHQDVTASRDFLLLCEAGADRTPGDLDEKTLQKISARINGKKHPSVLYLAAERGDARTGLETRGDPPVTVVSVDLPASGGQSIGLAIVVIGKAE